MRVGLAALVIVIGLTTVSGASAQSVALDGPLTSGTTATRAAQARRDLVDADGHALDGAGASIAVIDTGVDATHPSFRLPGGNTKVVRQITSLSCTPQSLVDQDTSCFTD